jgi:branched-chain amino acid transport system permease protein
MDLLLQLLANGLVTGAFYALSALGLTLVFGLMRVVNFAHGDLYVVGGLLGWTLTAMLGTISSRFRP